MLKLCNNKKRAFTMAELLVTMGVLGAVAAITLPTITSNIWASQLQKRATIESRKFTQAIENMVAFDDIAGKHTTDRFVATLKSYLKIAKVCEPEHIADCWPTSSITLYDGEKYDMEDTASSELFYKKDNLDPSNRAIVTEDGTSMLLAYNQSCNRYDKNAAVNCVVGLMDSNGRRGPNKLGQDVVLLNTSVFGPYKSMEKAGKEVHIDTAALTCIGNQECGVNNVNVEVTSVNGGKGSNFFDDDSGGYAKGSNFFDDDSGDANDWSWHYSDWD